MPELRRAAARCMLVADARIYIVDQFVLPCIDESRADGNAECAVCQAQGRSFLECVSVSETELAYSRTVNSLPHLDLVSLMERGAERGRGRSGAREHAGEHEERKAEHGKPAARARAQAVPQCVAEWLPSVPRHQAGRRGEQQWRVGRLSIDYRHDSRYYRGGQQILKSL